MTPEELHRNAVEAVHAWRDEERAKLARKGYRLVWVDTGSGPGHEIWVPDRDPAAGWSVLKSQ